MRETKHTRNQLLSTTLLSIKILFAIGILSVLTGLSICIVSSIQLLKIFHIPFYEFIDTTADILDRKEGLTISVLGIGGEHHEGPLLTDTIQVVHFSGNKNIPTSIIAVPRDLWSVTVQDRVNTAYTYGENDPRLGGGFAYTKTVLRELTGLPIHAVLLIDFSGFSKAIDVLGGVDVFIPEEFTDTQFPISGKENDSCQGDSTYACRYMSITFTKGLEHMSGERALMYVRSRHAEGEEGTDFARGKRQQEILQAILHRIFSPQLWFNFDKIQTLESIFFEHVKTDLDWQDILLVFHDYITKEDKSFKNIILESELIHPPENNFQGKYVLIPKVSYKQLQEYIQSSTSGELITNHFLQIE